MSQSITLIRVEATWDDEAQVWVATSDDVPGLVTEAKTTEELKAKLRRMIPELIEENGLDVECGESGIPFSLHGEFLAQGMAPCPTLRRL